MTARFLHDFYVYSRLGSRDRIVQRTLYGHILHINAPICIVHVDQTFPWIRVAAGHIHDHELIHGKIN